MTGVRSRINLPLLITGAALVGGATLPAADRVQGGLERIAYNHPGALADLGVGLWAWPVPVDRNADGQPDLMVISVREPYSGIFYFENSGQKDERGIDVFRVAERIGDARNNVMPSYAPHGLRVLSPGFEHPNFIEQGLRQRRALGIGIDFFHRASGRIRQQQWLYVDYNGNGILDLVVGVEDWTDYGWGNAYDRNGRWANGPLLGFIYVSINSGTNEQPRYEKPFRLQVEDRDLTVFGRPSPVFGDFNGAGRQDLICGEFVDGLTFFENIGTREQPRYAPGRRIWLDDAPLTLHACMIVVTGYDWDGDGWLDLVVAQEDGRVALIRHSGTSMTAERSFGGATDSPRLTTRVPIFEPPVFFRQEADSLKFGVLSAPFAVDWDGDGLEDMIVGNAAGEIAFVKNLGGDPIRWAEPELLEIDGKPFRVMAGYNGSIQGPAESKWGYTNLSVGDWNGNGLPDIIYSSITGRVRWLENVGTQTAPRIGSDRPIDVKWSGNPPKPAWNWWDPAPSELVVQWRCTPYVIDLDGDGIPDLVTVDHEGYLAFYRQIEHEGRRVVLPGERIFRMQGPAVFDRRHNVLSRDSGLLRMNGDSTGPSGRRTFCFVDWDGDGKLDLLVNSVNVNFLRNVGEHPGDWVFEDMGPLSSRHLAGHSTAPTILRHGEESRQMLVIGAEDGFFYKLNRPD